MSREPFVALPPRNEAANVFILSAVFAAWFVTCYGGAALLVGLIPWRVHVELPADHWWPLWPGAAALYLTIGPMLLLSPFVLRNQQRLLPLAFALTLETAVAVLCFLLLPVDDAQVDCCEPGVSAALFQLADALNLHHNNLPSLHVAFAVTLALAFTSRASAIGRIMLVIWAVAVSLSTLVTRQHFTLDVVAGTVLTLFCWPLAQRWARNPRVAAAVDVELLCLRNLALFARRHRRYFFIGLVIWPRRRLARTGFCFLQALDDLLDGDRPSEREPLEIADTLRASFASGQFGDDDLARLGAAFRQDLLARGGESALPIVDGLIRAMRRDRERVLAAWAWTREQLAEQHRATFSGSLDLMMLAADSPLRHGDVPLLIDALGWCSTVRDLDEDLAQGLINIPRDVVEAAQAESPAASLPALAQTNAVRTWLRDESARARVLLDRVDAQIDALGAQRGARTLRRFARSMRKYLL